MSSSDQEYASPLSQFSSDQFDDDEIVWTQRSHDGSVSDTDFILLRHPLLEARSIPSTLSDSTEPPASDENFSSAFDKLSLCDQELLESSSTSSEESAILPHTTTKQQGRTHKRNRRKARKAKRRAPSSDTASTESDDSLGMRTPTASYEEASAFISQYISSPVKGNGAELNLLRALIIELGLRSPAASDLPGTLTSARKVLKAEAHVNVKEYVATRHKGQLALQQIMKPSKNALRRDLRKGKTVSRQWVKDHGLQCIIECKVLLQALGVRVSFLF